MSLHVNSLTPLQGCWQWAPSVAIDVGGMFVVPTSRVVFGWGASQIVGAKAPVVEWGTVWG